jgi:hypothetical protein
MKAELSFIQNCVVLHEENAAAIYIEDEVVDSRPIKGDVQFLPVFVFIGHTIEK